jgi:hypothetical protein
MLTMLICGVGGIGDTVLQELGARVNERQSRAEGQGVTLGKVMLFNGGIFPGTSIRFREGGGKAP